MIRYNCVRPFALVIGLCSLFGCGAPPVEPPPERRPPATTEFVWSPDMKSLFTFDGRGGIFCSKDGFCVHIPKGSVTASTQVSGRKLPAVEGGVGAVYQLEVTGVPLLLDIQLELPVPEESQKSQLVVAFREGNVWKLVPTTDGEKAKSRLGTTRHFSEWTLLPAASCQAGTCLAPPPPTCPQPPCCTDGDTRPCGNDVVGECKKGTELCVKGVWSNECKGEIGPTTEICDGKDNDCDGVIDTLQRPCTNACGTGTESCANGTWSACDAPTPQPEVCDGKDNDCNGQIDDGITCSCQAGDSRICYGGPSGTLGVGSCRPGQQTCQGGSWGSCQGAVLPTKEVCNGLDDDCNGTPDDGLTGCQQSACPQHPTSECCNLQDDDCDGQIDEGLQCPDVGGLRLVKDGIESYFTATTARHIIDANQNIYIFYRPGSTPIQYETISGGTRTLPTAGNDFYVMKLNPQFKLIWVVEGKGYYFYSQHLALGANGDVFLTGRFKNTVTTSLGVMSSPPYHLDRGFAARISASGTWLYLKPIPTAANDPNHQSVHQIAVDTAGNAYVILNSASGNAIIKFDPTGQAVLWSQSSFFWMGVDGNNDVVALGTSVSKFSAAGQLLWSVPQPATGFSRVGFDVQNNVYLLSKSPLLMKLSPQGKLLWQRNILKSEKILNNGGYISGNDLLVSPQGDAYVLGFAYGNTRPMVTQSGGYFGLKKDQFAVFKMSSSGVYAWSQSLRNRPPAYYQEEGEKYYTSTLNAKGQVVALLNVSPGTDWQKQIQLKAPSIAWWTVYPFSYEGGVCLYGNCPPGQVTCGTDCVDLSASHEHCGQCGTKCSASEVCEKGSCKQPKGSCYGTVCAGSCANINNDDTHCGGCGLVCPKDFQCSNGACVLKVGACPPYRTLCDGRCVDLQSNYFHCGTCGNACPDPVSCRNGQCAGLRTVTCNGTECRGICEFDGASSSYYCAQCPGNELSCSATLQTRISCLIPYADRTCGGCGLECANGTKCSGVQNPKCLPPSACKAGESICSGSCKTLQTDPANCGSCDYKCPTGTTCDQGRCLAPLAPGALECDGQKVGDQDAFHCGACDKVCRHGESCWKGQCTACLYGLTRCMELCVDVMSDVSNCGGCGLPCATGFSCVQGKCECPTGTVSCQGKCIPVDKDPKNCGACGNVCPPAKPICGGGMCFPN